VQQSGPLGALRLTLSPSNYEPPALFLLLLLLLLLLLQLLLLPCAHIATVTELLLM
jgi:hypothetical protein